MKKKRIATFLTSVIAAGAIVTACGNNSGQNSSDSSSAATTNSTNGSRTQKITYKTRYKGRTYNKRALVYLPANYNANQKHDVFYLLHGSTEVNNGVSQLYREGNFKRTLDNLNRSGRLKNTIVVFPTYYPSPRQVSSSYYDDNPLNRRFAKTELMNDLVPAVEKRYKTYAKNTTKKQLQRSRNHRAFGGFSMGSITTWYVFQYDLPYFKYYMPMAGDSWTVTSDGGSSEPERIAQVLANSVRRNPNLKFKIMTGVGSNDGTSGSMEPQIRAMWRLPQFDRDNLEYYIQPGGGHDAPTMARIVNHYGNELFK